MNEFYRLVRKFMSSPPVNRSSHLGFLSWIKDFIDFKHIYDGGAAHGGFSVSASKFWPDAHFYLFEPLKEFEEDLKRLHLRKSEVVDCALTQSGGMAQINVHPDLYGSSIYEEIEGSLVNGKPRQVPAATLNHFFQPEGHRLVKLDLQGAEIDALDGGDRFFTEAISGSETVFLLEINLWNNMIGSSNNFANVVDYFASRDFLLLDVCGVLRRPLDGATAQVDLAFCHNDSVLRKDHRYATLEQRRIQFRNQS